MADFLCHIAVRGSLAGGWLAAARGLLQIRNNPSDRTRVCCQTTHPGASAAFAKAKSGAYAIGNDGPGGRS
jgi:hypothetical protein